MSNFPYKRLIVIGTTSSGKSTLAQTLATRLGLTFIELDALHWEPNWTEAPLDVFRERVITAIQAPGWVVAGNYRIVRDLIWPRAEAVIWLDYSFQRIFWQLARRTFKRWWTQELLWGTNRESLAKHFQIWSQDSLFHWLFKTYWSRRKEYPALFALPENRHLEVIRFQSPSETAEWLERSRVMGL